MTPSVKDRGLARYGVQQRGSEGHGRGAYSPLGGIDEFHARLYGPLGRWHD